MKIPQNFLCRYPLKLGAKLFGIILCVIMVASCIAAVLQVVQMKDCDACGKFVWRNAYACSVIVCLYCFIMLAINIWFLWGLKREKETVVLVWLVTYGLWLIKSIAMVIVMVCIYHHEAGFIGWLLSFIFSLVSIVIFIYLYLVVYGYWVQLRATTTTSA